MIKRLEQNELATTTPRSGLNHVSVFIERLLAMYDLQADMNELREAEEKERLAELQADQAIEADVHGSPTCLPGVAVVEIQPAQQATFGWYE